MAIDTSRLSRAFSFILHSGVEVFPIKVKRRTTGKIAFRVSSGGNTVEDSLEVEELEMIDKALNHRYSVRCSSIDGAIKGLYIVGGSSVCEVKRYSATLPIIPAGRLTAPLNSDVMHKKDKNESC